MVVPHLYEEHGLDFPAPARRHVRRGAVGRAGAPPGAGARPRGREAALLHRGRRARRPLRLRLGARGAGAPAVGLARAGGRTRSPATSRTASSPASDCAFADAAAAPARARARGRGGRGADRALLAPVGRPARRRRAWATACWPRPRARRWPRRSSRACPATCPSASSSRAAWTRASSPRWRRGAGTASPSSACGSPARATTRPATPGRWPAQIGAEYHEAVDGPRRRRGGASRLFAATHGPAARRPERAAHLGARPARREHVPVVLTGEGGDELFAGYPTYLGHRLVGLSRHLPDGARECRAGAGAAPAPEAHARQHRAPARALPRGARHGPARPAPRLVRHRDPGRWRAGCSRPGCAAQLGPGDERGYLRDFAARADEARLPGWPEHPGSWSGSCSTSTSTWAAGC